MAVPRPARVEHRPAQRAHRRRRLRAVRGRAGRLRLPARASPTRWACRRGGTRRSTSTSSCSSAPSRRSGCRRTCKYPTGSGGTSLVALCYISFFFLPYVTAGGALAAQPRATSTAGRCASSPLSFIGFGFFALIPAAPPWAAARCTAAQVAEPPANPPCMDFAAAYRRRPARPDDPTTARHADPWVERIADPRPRRPAPALRQPADRRRAGSADAVAAVPSLHAGGIDAVRAVHVAAGSTGGGVRCWSPTRCSWGSRLVYAAEHYVSDVAGGLAVRGPVVHLAANRIERRRKRGRPADTLERADHARHAERGVTTCQPTPPPATMPSSI